MVRNAYDVPGLKILNSPSELTSDTNSKKDSDQAHSSKKREVISSSNSSDRLR
ncbi:hypothetical protein B0P06_005080 [Clostridium saccharoperbutylacetonicum]|uniref:Uncharacterized protein n=1 Tax=Clostridium saccharoperbutylacetonicum N1-4(HMT) TaxID=931276 RepID=M1LUA5_9CLOT|nr:hypothetical protein [Clostridium saccharoperbutylacetonicum]AGF56645.1 hypothetical protein Cspa_c28820 [Clostridium saccharoperbutylacetonicum N1-4(HMT)]NRT62603.1 hypothetical protein [Clostridium saccharoperbutylacetonicum]NSB25951.1 hypothetical protein [Clostridium saccharoperbutylacetonicum]NSB45309.1 hypothetical protein [Clostridium saccharoperbutylacetonicum]